MSQAARYISNDLQPVSYAALRSEEQHRVQSRLKNAIADAIDFIETHRHTTRREQSSYVRQKSR
ncbi:hypothetical protein EXIGLDRAFT_733947 [Exidia glandulosa HHB12029]|uniref:Uncharacterized protein n=1 Tax=Exidia glandulosa HHB12029 TaxID=1314781 RepID=A0A165KCG2_EXIGL|nr:hypothetical protein EXIGLDRAFT_733947 [Exidia glandulosa HHB12029]